MYDSVQHVVKSRIRKQLDLHNTPIPGNVVNRIHTSQPWVIAAELFRYRRTVPQILLLTISVLKNVPPNPFTFHFTEVDPCICAYFRFFIYTVQVTCR